MSHQHHPKQHESSNVELAAWLINLERHNDSQTYASMNSVAEHPRVRIEQDSIPRLNSFSNVWSSSERDQLDLLARGRLEPLTPQEIADSLRDTANAPIPISPLSAPLVLASTLSPPLGSLTMNRPMAPATSSSSYVVSPSIRTDNWRVVTAEMRQRRARYVVLIERMLRRCRTRDPSNRRLANVDWRSKTLTLALKLERLLFISATSEENYADETTLYARICQLSYHLVQSDKHKNVLTNSVPIGRR